MKQIQYYGNKNIISSRVRKLRNQKSLSQEQLAARMQTMNCNVDQQMISKIENNNRQVTDFELACLCKCLETTPNEMLKDFGDLL